MSLLTAIAFRTLNTPLLLTPDKASVIASVLAGRIGIDAGGLAPEASRFAPNEALDGRGNPLAPYVRTPEGVGILTIVGTLVHRGAWIGAKSGLVSYEAIKFQLESIASDPKVRAVVLDIESPGGEAVGAMECSEAVRRLAAVKPVTAVVNGTACSSAYALASGARRIITTPSGISGSIGVVWIHADHSGQLAKQGIKPTLIFAGAQKVDGNPLEPLSKDARTTIEAEIATFYNLFVSGVSAGRGARLTEAMARATEARTYIGEAAVNVGLADAVGTFESALAEFGARPPARPTTQTHALPREPRAAAAETFADARALANRRFRAVQRAISAYHGQSEVTHAARKAHAAAETVVTFMDVGTVDAETITAARTRRDEAIKASDDLLINGPKPREERPIMPYSAETLPPLVRPDDDSRRAARRAAHIVVRT